ncbi:MAG: polyprenyl synthetase family protein, partial [Candidatus Syntrophosphaera sp.]|nr:polyprenyl synthetase family protein [Candidatus Syntrophosphaera sp.]
DELGKSVGKDKIEGKATYPSVFGIAASKSKLQELIKEARESIAPLGEKAELLDALAEYMLTRKS